MSKRNKDIKMTIFIMVAGIGLIIAGVIGIVTSRIDSREYKNSTDIRKIPAVIVDFSTKDDKEEDNSDSGKNGILTGYESSEDED